MTEPVKFEAAILSTLEEAQAMQEKIVREMERLGFSTRDVFALRLVIEEALTNAIRHGNRWDGSKQVHVFCCLDDHKVRVVITDQGDGFDPAGVPDPTDEEFIGRPNGRGISLMQTYMNLCQYSNGGRRITIERQRNSSLPHMQD
ncbi:MAG TPA: ATP-binding protein [Planctomycetaceae bacterium]|nr:ATP-binding protein [Planctomycetaceae bacterium]HQZ68084.1 ATP-binding protein [Planctomycetaceae bacterium]